MAKKAATKKKSASKKLVEKPAKPNAKRKKKAAPAKSFEQTLWDTADKLRGTVESSEYKHVVLSLIFLKFVSDRFEARRQEIIDEGHDDHVDMVEFYTMKNVFYLPEKSRWSTIVCLLYTSPSPRDS